MRLFVTLLLLAAGMLTYGQGFPTRPNVYIADSLRNGEWVVFYDSLGTEVQREFSDISHYCLMEINAGKPIGQVECFYENGIRSWTGRLVTIDPEIKQGRAIGYHENGAVQFKAFYENDSLQGVYQAFHKNGILESEGQMESGQKVGEWVFFYDNGNPIATVGHNEGKEDGATTIFYQNGKRNSKGAFKSGIQHGYWETYFESGVLANKGNYIQGQRDGEWIYYFEDGKISEVGDYREDGLNGSYKNFHQNGQMKATGAYKNGLADGDFEYYYDNGQLEAKGKIIKDLYQGSWTFYYANGEKKSEGLYVDDLDEGIWKYYYENGQFNRQETYKNGKLNGKVTYYHENGRLNAHGIFIDDQKDGEWEHFFSNGVRQGTVTHKLGVRHGSSALGNDQGHLLSKGVYDNGKKIGIWNFYNEDGSPYSSGEYKDDQRHGNMIFYFEDGVTQSEGKYQQGLREGNWKFYHANGELYAEGDYIEGKSNGSWVYYYDNGALSKKGEELDNNNIREWLFYDRQGRLKSKGSYSDGVLHGSHLYYDTLGAVSSEFEFVKGTKQSFSNLYDSVDNLSLRGDFENAWLTLESTEQAYYRENEKKALKKSDLLELYAMLYSRKRDFNKSEKYFKKSLKNTLKYKSDTSAWYTATLDDLADLHTLQKEYEKAYQINQRVLDKITARKDGKYSNEYAQAVRYLAISLMNLERHDEAIDMLENDLEFRKSLENQGKNVAMVYYNIIDGLYPNLSQKLDSTIANSIWFHKENNLKSNWSYPRTLYYKARVYQDKKHLDSAYACFGASVDAAIQMGDTVNPQFVYSLLQMGNYHYNKPQYDLSRPFYQRAEVLGENPLLKSKWIYPQVIECLTSQSWADNDYQKSIKYNEQLRDLGVRDQNKYRIGSGHTGMAQAYDQLGPRYEKEARENHEKAIATLSQIQKFNTNYVNANLRYASHLVLNQRLEKVFPIFRKVERYLTADSIGSEFYLSRTYNQMSLTHYNQYAYDSAIYYSQKVIDMLKQAPGESLQEYLKALRQIGDVMDDLNKDEEALTYYFRALNETEKYLGKSNEFYMRAQLKLAGSFSSQNNTSSSINYYEDGITLGKQIKGVRYMLGSSIQLAEEYTNAQQYDRAEATLNEVRQFLELNEEINTYEYTWCLRMLGELFEEQDNIKLAEDYMLQALQIGEQMYAPDSRDYATLIRRIGQFYLRQNEFEQAYQYVAPALEIVKNTLGEDVVLYAWYAETMSEILLGLDDYAQAVNLQENAASIYLNQIGEEQDYMDSQLSLGKLYAELGQYENSIDALAKARQAVVKKFSRYSFAYTIDTKEMASTYLAWNKPAEALKELMVVKDLYDSLGVHKGSYPSWHNLMGWAQHDLKNLEVAREHYQAAIHLGDSLWGPESGASRVYRNNLAFYYLEKEEFEETERLWLEVEDHFNSSDIASIEWMDNMAMLYTSWGKLDKANFYWDQINENLLARIKGDFPLLSESGKAAFWDAYKGNFEIFNTYAISASKEGNKRALGQMYNNQLQTKSLLLNSTTKERKRILNSGNKTLLDTYNRYINLKEDLVKYYGYTAEKLTGENIDLEELEKQAEGLEKALSINSDEEQKSRAQRNLTWRSVQRALLPGEAAVEIIRFRHFYKSLSDSILYAALILTPETTSGPILQVLSNGNFLEDKAMKAYRSYMNFKLEDKSSYEAFWELIDQHLKGSKKVYLSADGVYHQMNVATLQKEDGTFVGDEQEFNLVSSTRTISEIKKRTRKEENATAYIFGNPTFDLSHSQIESDVNERGLTRNTSYTRATTLENFSFAELPGTKVETSTVNDVLTQHQWATNLFVEENALEEELKRVNNPGVLHIATHGFFLDQPEESTSNIQLGIRAEASRENALLRSGLLMTGATQTAKGEQNNAIENGIFTAYEAMNLDLSSTELVVLSACETGLGEIKNGEGVYGLQRAFQIAGAKSILMSLWKVDDAATQLLMTSFYTQWLAGATETEALRKAQETVRESYPHPNHWGAFVLIGG